MIALLALWACDGDTDGPTAPTDAPADTGDTGDGLVHDPLSMPASPTLDPARFRDAESCRACHPDHVREWKTSMHAYAMHDPLFQALVEQRQVDLEGREDQFCTQCHSAIGTRGGEITSGFSFAELSPIVMEGITCTACHQVEEVVRTRNSGHRLQQDGPMRATIADPIDTPAHASEAADFMGSSEFCGACHDVVETDGLDLERPYQEWLDSPAKAEGTGCQGCHMPTTRRALVDGGPERDAHDHRWVGVDEPLTDGFLTAQELDDLRAGTRELLTGAAALTVDAPATVEVGRTFDLTLTVENRIPAHNLPTGSTFVRQVWLEVVVTDAAGDVVYETGTLDANGDLRDHWSELDPYGDADLLSFSSRLIDHQAAPTVFTWIADEHASTTLPPGYVRTATLFVPTDDVGTWPLTVSARLRFRALPPYLLRLTGLGDRALQVPIHDLATATTEVAQR
ncbi:MAG: hypothetical protein H6738_01235 [Alphaproteobacteria bacterium]|nr:hypothetical protein [Alphaproteobacteria bacterium]MCB9695391.1 hypothetical protein [Alphaproteobacteria bacterium]